MTEAGLNPLISYYKSYKNFLPLRVYKEGLCEFIAMYLCKEVGIECKERERPPLDEEFYLQDTVGWA